MKLFIIIFFILSFFCCKSKSDNKFIVEKLEDSVIENIKEVKDIKINWDTIPIYKLPFSSLKRKKDTLYKKRRNKYKNNIVNNFFSDSTLFKVKMYDSLFGFNHEHPSKMKGNFLYRLPDVNTNKILVYGYQEKYGTGYKGYTFELQVLGENNKMIDKLILEDSYLYECGYQRKFEIDKNYKINIIDNYKCSAIEKEDKHLERSKIVKSKFEVTSEGFIE